VGRPGSGVGRFNFVRHRRKLVTLFALAALSAPLAACGEDDVQGELEEAREDVRREARELEGNLDDLSKKDLREALRDVENAAEGGGKDAKREARELERKIERELRERN
jgi:hypothetical protein